MSKKSSEIAKTCAFRAHYSGEQSAAFWKTVRASSNRMLYDFCCALQDLESRVLVLVNEDIEMQVALIEALRKQERAGQRRRKR